MLRESSVTIAVSFEAYITYIRNKKKRADATICLVYTICNTEQP